MSQHGYNTNSSLLKPIKLKPYKAEAGKELIFQVTLEGEREREDTERRGQNDQEVKEPWEQD